jgi:hypothetical protein
LNSDYLQVVDAAVKQLRSGIVSAADVARGKTQLKAAILHDQESDFALAEDIGTQAVLLGSVVSGPALVSAVSSVTDAEVNAVSCGQAHGTRKVAAGLFQHTDGRPQQEGPCRPVPTY